MSRVSGVAVALACASALALSSCGSEEPEKRADATGSPSTSSTPTAPASDTPQCADVWQQGKVLPRPYRGCLSDGQLVAAHKLLCSSGQTLVLFDDQYFAVIGGTITHATSPLRKDATYLAAVQRCRG